MAEGGRQGPLSRSTGPRILIHEEAQLVLDDGRTIEVVILDTSLEGFRLRCNELIRGDLERAILRSPRSGDLAVEIRWTRGHEAGGIFLDDAPDVK
jgi:hypothetical protein